MLRLSCLSCFPVLWSTKLKSEKFKLWVKWSYPFFFWPSGVRAFGVLCLKQSLKSWHICDNLQHSASGSGLCPGWCSSPLLWRQNNTSDHYFSASQGINVFTYPIKDSKIGFDCCFFAMTIITSSRRAPAVLQNKTKWISQVSMYE